MSNIEKISSFKGKYEFLSNFYPCIVEFEGVKFPSAEHAFQAAKVLDTKQRAAMSVCSSAKDAKYWGHKLPLRKDWEQVKISVMKTIVKDKFARNMAYKADIQKLLLDTEYTYLENSNHYRDRFWGTVDGEGQNWLGKILMEVRDEIRDALQEGKPLLDDSDDADVYRVITVDQSADATYCANDFAYYTNVLYEINDIAMYSTIKRSKKWKITPETKQKAYYITLTQNLLSPAKENSKRWTYGVILDGVELSARYKISPYSEFEECIWLDNDLEFIDVAGCVKGIIVPKDKHFESSDDTMIRNIRKSLGRSTGSFDIVCY